VPHIFFFQETTHGKRENIRIWYWWRVAPFDVEGCIGDRGRFEGELDGESTG
jgi:hypothetical protein